MPLTKTPWHLLPLTIPIRSAPPLLVQSTFTSTTYIVHLTDLVTVWSESSSKREILARAERDGTAIDPSEDVSQLPILLEKLEYALGRKRDDAVDVEVLHGRDGLRLRTTIELPRPLGDLKWVFELKPVGGVELVNLLVLPALGEVATLRDMVESLLTIVKEKDVVLERLVERMGETGVDVRAMVGGGRRRGLEKFDMSRWRGEFLGGDRRAGEVVSEVFGQEGEQEFPGVKGLGGEAGEWWRGLDEDEDEGEIERSRRTVRTPKRSPEKQLPKVKATKLSLETDDDDDDDDEFEVQKTPPRAIKRTPRSVKKPQSISPPWLGRKLKSPNPPSPRYVADETTSEDDGLDVGLPPPRKLPTRLAPKPISPSKISPPSSKRVTGMIGGAGKTKSPSPALINTPIADEEDEDDMIVFVSKGEGKGESLEGEWVPSSAPAARKGFKMVIGGKKSTPGLPQEEEEKKVSMKKTIGKIGKIGGRKVALDENMVTREEDMAPSGSLYRITPPPPLAPPEPDVRETLQEEEEEEEEDEDEKADRKRRQLKKELEAKKKLPAKKKRKF